MKRLDEIEIKTRIAFVNSCGEYGVLFTDAENIPDGIGGHICYVHMLEDAETMDDCVSAAETAYNDCCTFEDFIKHGELIDGGPLSIFERICVYDGESDFLDDVSYSVRF